MQTNELIAAPAASLKSFAEIYRQELTGNILPFWLSHSKDEKNGGFFTCLDRTGNVYDTDKFMWLQGRQVWCFSYMYQNLSPRQEWLDMALHGARFMQQHGRDTQGNWYFSLTADGRPLVQPYNIFSDCFATMAFAALDKVQPSDTYKDIALSTFDNILRRRNNTKGNYNKAFPGTRPLKNFSLPMILCNLSLELEHILGSARVDQFVPEIIHEVMDVFFHPDLGVVLENVQPDGSFSDSFEGRVLNPGHAIEAMWFIMDLGKRRNDQSLINKAVDIMFDTLELGWDKEHGGIFYFLDVKGHPVQQLEWDQKLWWVHVEALVAVAKAYAYTGDSRCIPWFKKLHQYTWDHFRDKEYGEWFGYLNREGKVLLPLKGGKWKGCFHIPRSLYQVATTLSSLENQ
ncbi:MAG: AGE family epimerase/isomerase [Sediminibacterium sp.]